VAINVLSNDSDPDGQLVPSSVRIETSPQRGSVTVDPLSGAITYTHSGASTDSDSFRYSVADDGGARSNPATVSLTITAQPRRALLVTGSGSASGGDAVVLSRLQALGFEVTLRSGSASATGDATGMSLVVISATVSSSTVGAKFRTVAVPVLVWEGWIYDDFGMTSSSGYGEISGQSALSIAAPGHPLAAGHSGQIATSASATYMWGEPGAGATVVARLLGGQAAIFAYEAGAAMVGLAAPARRVGFFLHEQTAQSWTAAAASLFDAAVTWLAGPAVNQPPDVDAGSDLAGVVGVPLSLGGSVVDDGVSQPLVISWTVTAQPVGSSVALSNPGSAATTATFDTVGDYALRLQASDGEFTVLDALAVQIGPAPPPPVNQPPVVNAGPDTSGRVGTPLALSGSVQDDGLTGSLAIQWTVASQPAGSPAVVFGNPGAPSTTVTLGAVGTYVLRLNADDGEFQTFDEVTLTADLALRRALFITGSGSATGADAVVLSRLQALGFEVTLRSGSASAAGDAAGMNLVVISATVSSTTVGTKFRTVAVPVLVWEGWLYDDFGMTSSSGYGEISGQSALAIAAPGHPLAAGLSGQIATSASATYMWGTPGAGATVAARLLGGQAAIFGYEAGATMVGLAAPARRVGFFLHEQTAQGWTAAGASLFDAAVNWAAP
jgi:alkylated DNA nucleotide flippase Atl1